MAAVTGFAPSEELKNQMQAYVEKENDLLDALRSACKASMDALTAYRIQASLVSEYEMGVYELARDVASRAEHQAMQRLLRFYRGLPELEVKT